MTDTLDSPSQAISLSTREECVRLLFRLARTTVAASLIVSLITVWWLWEGAHSRFLGTWLVILLLLALATFALGRAYRRKRWSPQAIERWEQAFALVSAGYGLAWGAIGFIKISSGDAMQQASLVLLLGIVALVGTGALVASRIAFYSFIFTALGPLATHLITDSALPFPIAGWALLAYLILLLALHELFHRNLLLTIDKRFQSDALAQEQQVIFDTASEGIALLRANSVVKCNRQFAELLGYPVEELLGQPPWAWHPSYEEWKVIADECQPVIATGQVYRHVARFKRKNGELFWGEISGKAVDPAHPERGSVWLGRDISEQLRTDAALRSSEARFRDLLSLSSDWYWEQDRDFRFTRSSGGVLARSGHTESSVIGKRRWEIAAVAGVSEERWQAHRAALEQHLPFRDFVYQIALPDGDVRWVSVSGKPLFDERGAFKGYHGVGSDITERVRSAEQLHHLAHHDTLTGLPNRRLLSDRLDQALALARRAGKRVALMVLDLDDFKIINDAQGHTVGDEVLIVVSQRLRGAVRESDTVARFGGDEFVVLLPDLALPRDAFLVAEKIIDALSEPVTIGERQFQLGVSIGIAHYPEDADNGERLLQYADVAMYQAKRRSGSNYQVCGAAIPVSELPNGAQARH